MSRSPSELPGPDLREQTLGSSGMYLTECQMAWRTEGPKNVAEFQGSPSSKLRSDAFEAGGTGAKTPGGIHGWLGSCWANSEQKEKVSGSGKEDRWPERNTGTG